MAESLERERALEEASTHYQRVLELSPEDQRVREKFDALTKKAKRVAVPPTPEEEKKVKRWPLLTLAVASVGVLVLALAAFFVTKELLPKPETPTPTKVAMVVSPTATLSPMITPSPQPTVTNIPMVTPTAAIPAVVTATETPIAISTPVPPTAIPTQTPTATDTSVPPTPIPTQTPTTTPTSTQTPTSTPSMLQAPQSLWPEDGHKCIEHEAALIDLQWTWVRPLAEDEWFTLGLRYRKQGELVYAGEGKLKEKKWRVPSYLFGKADQPERAYYWDVAVIKVTVNQDGNETITPISLTSEPRTFYWP